MYNQHSRKESVLVTQIFLCVCRAWEGDNGQQRGTTNFFQYEVFSGINLHWSS